jgi:hypothetical protein
MAQVELIEQELIDTVKAYVDAAALDVHVALRQLLEVIGQRTVAYLRSFTGNLRPPILQGGPMRPAHPGGWADVTGELARSYAYRVVDGPTGASLELTNDSGHAIYLETHEGFFVLSGVTQPGGPVEQAILRVVKELAPEWEVRI